MDALKKIGLIFILLVIFLFGVGKRISEAGCGQVVRKSIDQTKCKKEYSCKPPNDHDITYTCYINKEGQCVFDYYWEACYSHYNTQGKLSCEYKSGWIVVDCTPDGGGGGGPSYEMTTCDEGKYLSCGSSAEATQQNKSFCGYKKTCNKYYFPSSYNFPECKISSEGNPLYTCRTNCSCCDIGTERTCTLGASYTNTVSLYVGGGDPVDGVYNQMMKDTCYRDGVKRRNDIVVSITLKRSYTKKDNTEWQDWEQSCRVQNCSCKAPPTPTLTPQNKQRPADGFAKRISGWESPHPFIRLNIRWSLLDVRFIPGGASDEKILRD